METLEDINALGLAVGAYKDMTDPELKETMEELVRNIKELFAAAAAPKPA